MVIKKAYRKAPPTAPPVDRTSKSQSFSIIVESPIVEEVQSKEGPQGTKDNNEYTLTADSSPIMNTNEPYRIVMLLGKGNFGQVHLVKCKKDNILYVAKEGVCEYESNTVQRLNTKTLSSILGNQISLLLLI